MRWNGTKTQTRVSVVAATPEVTFTGPPWHAGLGVEERGSGHPKGKCRPFFQRRQRRATSENTCKSRNGIPAEKDKVMQYACYGSRFGSAAMLRATIRASDSKRFGHLFVTALCDGRSSRGCSTDSLRPMFLKNGPNVEVWTDFQPHTYTKQCRYNSSCSQFQCSCLLGLDSVNSFRFGDERGREHG